METCTFLLHLKMLPLLNFSLLHYYGFRFHSGLMILNCAVDVPDTSCHWYVANADNTFGDGFDWETSRGIV